LVKSKDLCDKIMAKIEKEKIAIKPCCLVQAEKIGLAVSLLISVLMSVLIANFVFYWLKKSGSWQFLFLGNLGLKTFLQSFPFLWVLFGILFFALVALLLREYDFSYCRPYLLILFLVWLLVLVSGSVLALSGMNEKVSAEVQKGGFSAMKNFYPDYEQGFWCQTGLLGRVLAVRDSQMDVISKARLIKLLLTEKTVFIGDSFFEKGDWIRTVGQERETFFEVIAIQKSNYKLTNSDP